MRAGVNGIFKRVIESVHAGVHGRMAMAHNENSRLTDPAA
jgi:hypothetical protein